MVHRGNRRTVIFNISLRRHDFPAYKRENPEGNFFYALYNHFEISSRLVKRAQIFEYTRTRRNVKKSESIWYNTMYRRKNENLKRIFISTVNERAKIKNLVDAFTVYFRYERAIKKKLIANGFKCNISPFPLKKFNSILNNFLSKFFNGF